MLIGYQKPHKPVSTNTVARWLKNVMAKAGIDTSVYKAHSTRAAVTSAAKGKQVPIDTILSAAGWSNRSTSPMMCMAGRKLQRLGTALQNLKKAYYNRKAVEKPRKQAEKQRETASTAQAHDNELKEEMKMKKTN